MGNQITFVEQAREEAESSPVHKGDEVANELLASARKRIYHWPFDFGGFAADLEYTRDGETVKGTLVAKDSQHFRQDWDRELERDDRIWMSYQLGELLAHRESPEKSKMASKSGVLWGDFDPVFGRQIIFPEDPMGSYYRIQENKITQIARHYPKSRFIINIDSHHDFDSQFAAHCYSAFYWSRESGAFQKTETYVDQYLHFKGIYLPSSRRYSVASSTGLSNREVSLKNHRFLDVGANVHGDEAPKCPFH